MSRRDQLGEMPQRNIFSEDSRNISFFRRTILPLGILFGGPIAWSIYMGYAQTKELDLTETAQAPVSETTRTTQPRTIALEDRVVEKPKTTTRKKKFAEIILEDIPLSILNSNGEEVELIYNAPEGTLVRKKTGVKIIVKGEEKYTPQRVLELDYDATDLKNSQSLEYMCKSFNAMKKRFGPLDKLGVNETIVTAYKNKCK